MLPLSDSRRSAIGVSHHVLALNEPLCSGLVARMSLHQIVKLLLKEFVKPLRY
jgi:hypothetical protein